MKIRRHSRCDPPASSGSRSEPVCSTDVVRLLPVLCLLLGCFFSSTVANAAVWNGFDGFVDLTAVQTRADDRDEETFRQEYSLSTRREVLPWLEARGAFRYLKFDQDLDASLGSYREELQPSGALRWNHPLFLAQALVQQRRVRPQFSTGHIITDDLQAAIETRSTEYPILGLRWDSTHRYTEKIEDADDIDSRRIQATVDYARGANRINYSISRQDNDNVISGLESRNLQHQLRWNGAATDLVDNRLQLNGNYLFNHATQTNEVAAGEPVFDVLPVPRALYARDDAPDFGALDPVAGLVDGDREARTDPEIDLGGDASDHNLGVDLGGLRPVGAVYVYTDRPSGLGVRWRVYWSDDNLNWEDWSAAPAQRFNALLNRYEIEFPAISKRYFKVVSEGLNDIAEVYVTDLEVLEELVPTRDDRRIRSEHQADGRASYRISRQWSTSLDASLGTDRTHSTDDARHRLSYSWQLSFKSSESLQQFLRWGQSWQQYPEGQSDQLTQIGVYTAAFQPLPTLRGNFSLTDRMTYEDGDLSQDALGGTLDSDMQLLEGLDLKLRAGLSRFRNWASDDHFISGSTSTGLEADLTRRIDLQVGWSFLESHERKTDRILTRRSLNLGAAFQVTNKIFLRGTLRLQSEFSDSRIEDYLLTWNLTPDLRISAQSYVSDGTDRGRTERRSVNVNYDIGARTTLYVRAGEIDLTESGGVRTLAYQQGFRMGF